MHSSTTRNPGKKFQDLGAADLRRAVEPGILPGGRKGAQGRLTDGTCYVGAGADLDPAYANGKLYSITPDGELHFRY